MFKSQGKTETLVIQGTSGLPDVKPRKKWVHLTYIHRFSFFFPPNSVRVGQNVKRLCFFWRIQIKTVL